MLSGFLRSRRGAASAALIVLGFAVAPATALDRVSVVAPGADSALEARLRNSSLLIEAQTAGVEDSQELLAAARAEYGRMVSTLYGEGFYSPVVSVRLDGREASEFSPLEVPGPIREITVTVETGRRFAFSRAEITPLAPETELPEGFAVDEPARSGVVRDAARAAVDGWRAASHAKAAPGESRIVANHPAATLDVRLAMRPGPPVTFGRLIIRGEERTRTNRVRKIAGLPEGAPFDPEAVQTAATRLRRTGTFASVALTEAEALGPGDTLDITATLIEAPLRRFGFGAEFDSDDGVRLSGFWLHRNLLGGAERLRVEGEVGGIGGDRSGPEVRFALRLARPATVTPDTTATFDVTLETVRERDYDSRQASAALGFTHIFSDRLTGSLAAGFFYERTRDVTGRRSRSVFALPASLRYDRRDDERDTRSGYFLEGTATPFYGLGETDSGGRIALDARGFLPAGERVVLAGRVQLGSVLGASLENTPRDFLFLSGGSGTVRGQPYRSLGVELPGPGGETVLVGGRGFAGLSAEVRTDVTGQIGLVGFVDAGYVSAASGLSGGDWHAGAGIGLRYRTGIGPIRVDIAGPVSGDTGNGPQLYVGIGQAF
jgi:translocation and assembly module TamA